MSTEQLTPFRIRIPGAALDDLLARLESARFPEPLPGDGWDTGVPIAYLRDLTARWTRFDWRATEARLNELPQFTTAIDGQTIHFVHVRSGRPGAVPLLLTHGWPGSFLEFERLIPLLTEDDEPFDVVVPSIPGFGFSTPLCGTRWTTRGIAAAWLELMTRLGYERFAVQGGDLGAGVAPDVARLAPERVIGVHVNGALGTFVSEVDEDVAATMTPLEKDRMRRVAEFMRDEFGYIALQSTRPGLIGAMAADSPVAQLAWIVDKLKAWTHPADALPEDVVGEEFVLANASLYWFTASAGSSAMVGYALEDWDGTPEDSGVPTAALQFAHDIGLRHVAEQSNTIVRWTDVTDRGGHFAALEEPHLLATDLREFLHPPRP